VSVYRFTVADLDMWNFRGQVRAKTLYNMLFIFYFSVSIYIFLVIISVAKIRIYTYILSKYLAILSAIAFASIGGTAFPI